MGYQINYGFGYGFMSSYGSNMLKIGSIELLSKGLDLQTLNTSTANPKDKLEKSVAILPAWIGEAGNNMAECASSVTSNLLCHKL